MRRDGNTLFLIIELGTTLQKDVYLVGFSAASTLPLCVYIRECLMSFLTGFLLNCAMEIRSTKRLEPMIKDTRPSLDRAFYFRCWTDGYRQLYDYSQRWPVVDISLCAGSSYQCHRRLPLREILPPKSVYSLY